MIAFRLLLCLYLLKYIYLQVRQELSPFWPVLVDELPKKLISQTAPTVPVASFVSLFV